MDLCTLSHQSACPFNTIYCFSFHICWLLILLLKLMRPTAYQNITKTSCVWPFIPGNLWPFWKVWWWLSFQSQGSAGLNVQAIPIIAYSELKLSLYKGHQWSLYKAVNIVHFDFESSFLKVGVLISSWTLPLAKYFLKPLCGIPCRFWNITIQELAPFLSTFWFWVAFQIKTLWTFNSSWTWGTFPF